jgi:hypothetical protein
LLKRLLQTLEKQETDGLFTFSIVVADNDGQRSAEALVSDFAADAAIAVTYCVEPLAILLRSSTMTSFPRNAGC